MRIAEELRDVSTACNDRYAAHRLGIAMHLVDWAADNLSREPHVPSLIWEVADYVRGDARGGRR